METNDIRVVLWILILFIVLILLNVILYYIQKPCNHEEISKTLTPGNMKVPVYLILDGVSIIPPQYMEFLPRKGEQIERDTLFYEVTQIVYTVHQHNPGVTFYRVIAKKIEEKL